MKKETSAARAALVSGEKQQSFWKKIEKGRVVFKKPLFYAVFFRCFHSNRFQLQTSQNDRSRIVFKPLFLKRWLIAHLKIKRRLKSKFEAEIIVDLERFFQREKPRWLAGAFG